ncbi:MAG: ice-binding family protein [Bacteroidales bacterium]|nr:ice-binding family protein [Bacteroidales bacterium]
MASNIFWQVGSSATFGTTSVFKGTVLAMQSITFNTGATLDGRGLARTGGVTMAGNTIVKQ